MSTTEQGQQFGLSGARIENLSFIKHLGTGQQQVWLAQCAEVGTPVAVKVFAFSPDDPNRALLEGMLETEVDALRTLSQIEACVQFFRCPAALRYYAGDLEAATFWENHSEAVHDAQRNGLLEEDVRRIYFKFVVMEYVDGKDLKKGDYHRKKASSDPLGACQELAEVTKALAIVHERNFVHRDLKPENLLWSEAKKRIKITDFGLAKKLFGDGLASGAGGGTYAYLAPELIDGGRHSRQGDVYALAVTIYYLLTGELPFNTKVPENPIAAREAWKQEHEKKDRPNPLNHCSSWMSASLAELIMRGFSVLPENRPSMAEIAKGLEIEAAQTPGQRQSINKPQYSFPLFDQREPICWASPVVLDPSTRFQFLKQEAYWVQIQMAAQDRRSVSLILEVFAQYTKGRFRICEVYGFWSFLANFWDDGSVDLMGLWSDLDKRVDLAHVMRCTPQPDLLETGKKYGRITKAQRVRLDALVPDIKKKCQAYQSYTSNYAADVESLCEDGYAHKTSDMYWSKSTIETFCFVKAPATDKELLQTDSNTFFTKLSTKTRILQTDVEKYKKLVRYPFVYQRSEQSIKALDKIKTSPDDLLITFFAKDHTSRYYVSRAAIGNWTGCIASSSAATGWYSYWRESDAPIEPAARQAKARKKVASQSDPVADIPNERLGENSTRTFAGNPAHDGN